MTKVEFVKEVASKTGKSQKDVSAFIDAYHEVVTETLRKGEDVKSVGFGSYVVKDTPAREVLVNPKQPELGKKTLPPSVKVSFKVSQTLKDTVKEASK